MAVYLLHFERPIAVGHPTQHYIGFAEDRNLQARLTHHLNGTGARLTQVARERGIAWHVAGVWPGKDRAYERWLKSRKMGSRLCRICKEERK